MKRKKMNLIVILFLWSFLLTISIIVFDSCKAIMQTDKIFLDIDNGDVLFQVQHNTNPTESSIRSYSKLFESLKNIDSSVYYELYGQPLDINKDFHSVENMDSDSSLEGYGRVPCVQISKNVQDDFNLKIETGRMFNGKDFILDINAGIPVYMGSKYANVYSIGDQFCGEYLFDKYNFYIIGFLKEKTLIQTSLNEFNLDNYIIMPSFEVSDNNTETDGLRIHYANKVSGIIKTSLQNANAVINTFLPLISNSDVGEFSWYSSLSAFNFRNLIGIELNTCYTGAFVMFVLLLLIGIIGIVLNKKNLSLVETISFKSIRGYIAFTCMLILSVGVFLYIIQILLHVPFSPSRILLIPSVISSLLYLIFLSPAIVKYFKSRNQSI